MTVAAVAERDGRFLVVEEIAEGARVINQPAGHLEPHERLVDAVVREVLEEARMHFVPEAIVGVYRWVNPGTGETHVRVSFAGRIEGAAPERTPEDDILDAHWLTYDELEDRRSELRSPLVLGSIDDYLRGCRYPLDILRDPA